MNMNENVNYFVLQLYCTRRRVARGGGYSIEGFENYSFNSLNGIGKEQESRCGINLIQNQFAIF